MPDHDPAYDLRARSPFGLLTRGLGPDKMVYQMIPGFVVGLLYADNADRKLFD